MKTYYMFCSEIVVLAYLHFLSDFHHGHTEHPDSDIIIMTDQNKRTHSLEQL